MKAQACAFAASAVLVTTLMTGCSSIPRTKANLHLCAVAKEVFDHQAPLFDLTAATLMNNYPITHKLRQDAATYIGFAVSHSSNTLNAEAQVRADCGSMGG